MISSRRGPTFLVSVRNADSHRPLRRCPIPACGGTSQQAGRSQLLMNEEDLPSLALSPISTISAQMRTDANVVIVGAGQAGLATSWFLTQANVDHVVLEAGRVGETWRSRRWDSFCLVTPNWTVQLPGGKYSGPDPDGLMDLAALIDHFQGWADSFDAPGTEGCAVWALDG